MATFCTHCGTKADEDDAFCGSCGKQIRRMQGSPPSPSTPTASASSEESDDEVGGQPSKSELERRAPAATTPIPIEPNPTMIVSGILLALASAWMMFSFLPAHEPLGERDVAFEVVEGLMEVNPRKLRDLTTWRFAEGAYRAFWGVALLLLIGGISQIVHGFIWRRHEDLWCARCKRMVRARRRDWGAWCGFHRGYARFDTVKVVVAIVFVLVVAVMVMVANRSV